LPGLPPSLTYLGCWGNGLAGILDVSYLHSLEWLVCSNNRLTGLALSYSAPYSYIDAAYNNMANTSAITGRTINWDNDPDFLFTPQNTGDDSICSHAEWKEETVTPATCTEKGQRKVSCKLCGVFGLLDIEPLGHAWDEGVVTTPATVGNAGVKTFTCTRLGCGETKTEAIPALPSGSFGDGQGGSSQTTPPPQQAAPTPTPTPTQIQPVVVPQAPFTNPFTDVASGAWYHSNVMHVYREGLMTGTSATQFSPNVPTTRGMIVTILYRLNKSPAVAGLPNPFSDVAEGTWYTDAVKWAAANGIVSGLGEGRFGPMEDVTREQLATILNNYANYAKMDLPTIGEYPGFADGKDIASYAKAAVERLSKAGIVGGKPGNNFDPRGNATRAEVASMLTRLTTAI